MKRLHCEYSPRSGHPLICPCNDWFARSNTWTRFQVPLHDSLTSAGNISIRLDWYGQRFQKKVLRSISFAVHFIVQFGKTTDTKWVKHLLEVRLCWPPSSWTLNIQRQDCRKLRFRWWGLPIVLHWSWSTPEAIYKSDWIRPVVIQTSTANKTPCCGHRDMHARISKHATHNTKI